MTSQNAQIQALINGIDEVLAKNSPRLPWVMSNDAMQQRQVLEQARQYLTSLQQQLEQEQRLGLANPSQAGQLQASQAAGQAADQLSGQSSSQLSGPPAESAQQVLQAVLQEMNYWRANMLQPMRNEVDLLQRQRDLLTQEIRQLEAQRQQNLIQGGYGQAASAQNQQLMEFLQAAMGQMQANLSSQVTQMIAALPQQSNQSGQLGLPPAERANLAALSPAERLAQMQQMQTQSDQLMLKLDSTLQIIFESLNRNVQTYQDSLEQGLNRMHTLGQQGEAMFALLVNRLAQQLGREASSFLQAGPGAAPDSSPEPGADAASPVEAFNQDFKVADFLSQPPSPASRTSSTSFVPAVPFNLSEEVLDIADLDADLDADLADPGNSPTDPALGALNQEISQLDLAMPDLDQPEPEDLFAAHWPASTLAGTAGLASTPPVELGPTPEPSGDLDSALDLLNQLSAEMQSGLEDETQPDFSPEPATADFSPELITAPEALYDEAFYSRPARPDAEPQPARDTMTLEENWLGDLGESQPAPASSAAKAASPSDSSVSQSLKSFLPSSSPTAPAAPAASTTSGGDLFAAFGRTSPPAPAETSPQGETLADLAQDLVPQVKPEETLPVAEAGENLDLGMTVDDLADLATPAKPFPHPSASQPQGKGADAGTVTLEGLEQLFEDLPDASTNRAANQSGGNAANQPGAPDLFGLDASAESEKKNR